MIVRVGYGVLLPTIEEQLRDQGVYIDGAHAFEKQRHAINVLAIADLITESEADKAIKRLHGRVVSAALEATT